MSESQDWELNEFTDDELGEQTWELEEEIRELYNKSLDDLLEKSYPEGDTQRIGVRYLPTGLMSWLKETAKKYPHCSLSKVQKATTAHGASILFHDERMKDLIGIYNDKWNRVKRSKSRTDLAVLERSQTIQFVSPLSRHTTIATLARTTGYTSSLADVLGIRVNTFILYLALLSLNSLVKKSDLKDITQEEIERFWIHVRRRKEDLLRS